MTPLTYHCSFCGLEHRSVKKMIAGPAVFICDACVELCVDVLLEERSEGRLKMLGERTNLLAETRRDLDAARARTRELERAIRTISGAVADTLPAPHSVKCMWCDVNLDDENAAREHVAICDKHPAVVKLREVEAKASKRRAR